MLRQLTIKFLHRVRIHGGEFDSSARAMNRVEESNFFQADLRKFRGSTFERKQMSTTIKRIALVAVAALGLGVVSVAPSQAVSFSDSLTLSSATATQLTGDTATASSATATLSFLAQNVGDTLTVTASLVSAPAGNVSLPQLMLAETTSAEAKAGANVLTTNSASGVDAGTAVLVYPKGISSATNVSAKFKVYLNAPEKVGTYVVKLTPAVVGGGGTLNATAQTLTITVTQNAATDPVVVAADSILNAGETVSATADVAVTAAKAASTTAAAAVIKVTLKNANASTISDSFTATIAGPGILGAGAFGTGASLDDAVQAKGRALSVRNGDVVAVFPDGSAGVATITIGSSAGVILATEKVTFFGDAATITASVLKTVIGTGSNTKTLEVTVKDAAGVSVSNLDGKLGVVSSYTIKISTAYASLGAYDVTTGTYTVDVTGVAAGSANLTVTTKTSSTATTGVDAAAAVSVRVGSYKPASVRVSTDKSSYAPGEKGSIKVELLDADGLEVVSGETYTATFDADGIVSSYALSNSTLPGANVVSYASGGRLYTFYAPITEGDVKFSWTTGATASYGVKGAAGGLATANQGVAGSVTIAVSSAATSAAIDAANEASQAASDATDAALAAADAADEATTKAQEAVDAVATLSAEVTKMINALKAQIKTLSNLVTKIAKKVKA